jgi:hypothetical protein
MGSPAFKAPGWQGSDGRERGHPVTTAPHCTEADVPLMSIVGPATSRM